MKIAIGTDHRGVDYKKELIEKLGGFAEIIDGSPVNDPLDDYPDFAFRVAKMVVEGEADYGILICGTGIGMSIAANKVKGIRCALVTSAETAILARSHNDANMMAISSAMDPDFAVHCIKLFANTKPDTDEKHHRRVQKIIDYENGEYDEL